MSRETVENVPQVQEYSLLSMWELMEVALWRGSCGWEKLCTARNLPGFDVLGTRERGEDWKGPSSASTCWRVKGPT